MRNDDAGSGADPGVAGQPSRFELTQLDFTGAVAAVVSNRSSREEIRVAMRPLCARARQEEMNAAELVKVVKQSFATSAGGTGFGGATERQQMLDRIISVCIDEYYAVG
ncbi:hypothetical protein BH23GEM2_BH23GEM2_01070 [soil metagenome]